MSDTTEQLPEIKFPLLSPESIGVLCEAIRGERVSRLNKALEKHVISPEDRMKQLVKAEVQAVTLWDFAEWQNTLSGATKTLTQSLIQAGTPRPEAESIVGGMPAFLRLQTALRVAQVLENGPPADAQGDAIAEAK